MIRVRLSAAYFHLIDEITNSEVSTYSRNGLRFEVQNG